MKRMLATLMVLSLSLALLAGCGSQGNNAASGSNAGANGETYTMRISHAVAETHPSHQTLLAFEKAVEEGTNGAVQVELIPNGALGGETQLAEMVQLGSLQGTVIGADAASGIIPEFATSSRSRSSSPSRASRPWGVSW